MSLTKLFWLVPIILFTSCGNREANGVYEKNGATAVPGNVMATDSTAILINNKALNSPERKVIHTADFHCKVQNVFNATTRLEQLVKSVGGIVQESHMDNVSDAMKTTYYKPDSLHQSQTYTTTSLLTLRVPSQYLDSVINSIPGMTSFINSRTLKQSDITWAYLANELKNVNDNTNATTSQALKLAKKSREPIEVQQYADKRHEQMVDRKMANLLMIDEVSYATITVALSQPEQVYIQTIVNPDYFARAPFSLQCKEALANGLNFVKSLFVGLISIWPLLILFATGAVIALYVTNRKKRHLQPAGRSLI
jgi:hypothetical protein